jgi:DNA-binding FadR family transcriptional regulator
VFNPVQRGNVPEEIVNQIEEAVLLQKLKAGDRLRPERELKKIFQASRGTIREALSILKQKGLITIKRGASGGAYISNLTVDKASEGLAFLIRQRRISFNELAEFRECAEGMAAGLAAERATNKDIAELKGLILQMKHLIDIGNASWDEFYQLERMAHETLARQCGNTILVLVLTTIHVNLDSYAELIFWDKHGPYESYSDWLEIVDGLEKREATRVSSLIRSHVSRFSRTIREGARRKELAIPKTSSQLTSNNISDQGVAHKLNESNVVY